MIITLSELRKFKLNFVLNDFYFVFFCSKEARWSKAYESQTPQVNVTSYDKYWSLIFLDSSMHYYYSMYMHGMSGRVM